MGLFVIFSFTQPIPSNEIVPAAKFVEKYGFLDFESEEPLFKPVGESSAQKKNAYLSEADEKTAPYHASGRHTKDIMRVRRLLREGAER